MAGGMEMMLKSLGLDPKMIMGRVEEFQKNITQLLTAINTRLESIDKRQTEIEGEIKCLRNQLQNQQLQPPIVQPGPNPPPQLQPVMQMQPPPPPNQPQEQPPA